MNERIRELLKQSTNPPWDGEQGPMNEFNLEKFAELIVRECAKAAGDFEYARLHDSLVEDHVLKHFGVEEQDSTCPDCGEDGGTQCGSINRGY